MWIVIETIPYCNPSVALLTRDIDIVLYMYPKGFGWNIEDPDNRFQKDKVTVIKNSQAGRQVLVYYKEEM